MSELGIVHAYNASDGGGVEVEESGVQALSYTVSLRLAGSSGWLLHRLTELFDGLSSHR